MTGDSVCIKAILEQTILVTVKFNISRTNAHWRVYSNMTRLPCQIQWLLVRNERNESLFLRELNCRFASSCVHRLMICIWQTVICRLSISRKWVGRYNLNSGLEMGDYFFQCLQPTLTYTHTHARTHTRKHTHIHHANLFTMLLHSC